MRRIMPTMGVAGHGERGHCNRNTSATELERKDSVSYAEDRGGEGFCTNTRSLPIKKDRNCRRK